MAEQEDGAGRELEAEIAGQKLKLKGYHIGNILQIVLALVIGYAGLQMYEARGELKNEHGVMTLVLQKQLEAQVEFNYIITLKQDDRERLNLRMPESLRNKVGILGGTGGLR
jgi:hypothetical protein